MSERHILLQGVVGSTAYGLAGPDSDVDRIGIFAYDTQAFLGLDEPRGSHVTTGPDVTLHEARKAAKLILDCNPTASEILWLPDDLYEVRTPLGDDLIAHRAAFLSAKRARSAYLGYATDQFRKLLLRGDGSFSADTRKRTAKHARHLMRLVDQGFELYTTGTVRIRLEDPQRYLDFGKRVAADPQAAVPFMAEVEARFDAARTVLADVPDRAAIESWLLRVRATFYNRQETCA